MRRSSVAVSILCSAIVLFSSTPANAHAGFVGAPNGYPANSDQALTLKVPHERDDVTYNVDVVVAMPSGWIALSCENKATWTCSLDTVDARQVVRFTKASGAGVAEDENFQFAARIASTAGSYAFPTVQTYNTGEIVRWIGAAGTDKPAPTLVTLPGGTAPQSTPSTTNPDARPTTPSTVVVPPATTVASASTSSSPTTTAPLPSTTTAPRDDNSGGNGALLAVVVAVLGATAVAGGVFAYRRRQQYAKRANR